MSHQTFYIDIDEEITSIVDRLRRTKAREVIIVVPKRAMLIQSIVNLKLLKKEADSLKKDLAIVTQDKLGKLLVEKTGIAVQQKLDETEGEEMIPLEIDKGEDSVDIEEVTNDKNRANAKNRLEALGSSEYFEESPKSIEPRITVRNDDAPEKIVNRELVTEIGEDIKKSRKKNRGGSLDIVRNTNSGQFEEDDAEKEETEKFKIGGPAQFPKTSSVERPTFPESSDNAGFEKGNFEELSENEKMEKFFKSRNEFAGRSVYVQDKARKKQKTNADYNYGGVNLSGKLWKYIAYAIGVIILVVAGAAAYLFLPKANINIFVKTQSQSVDAQVKGDQNQTAVDLDQQVIPARVVSINDQLTEEYQVTGNASGAGQKARGTVTIYNEYSSSQQPLVATTRFESPEGKIFRLAKGVTVPGMTSGTPGAIEADVVADESGDSYNIGPSRFTIPGFKSSGDKYNKFYAKSFKDMSGGGSSGTSAKSVSAGDIAGAKNKTLDALTKQMKSKLQNEAGSGSVVLDDAISVSDATYSASNSEGEVVDKFTVTVKAKATAITFKENDLRTVLEKDIAKVVVGANKIDENSLALQYGKSDTDFTAGTITIRVNASGKIGSGIDLENLKKGILGKSEDDFKAYLKSYPSIVRAEISYSPSFITGHIPAYESRVTITLDSGN
jgi:hypothetical protein